MTAARFHPDARAELLDAATYYEGLADGLGGRLIDAVQHAVEQVSQTPGLGAPVAGHGALRRRRVRRFPYALVYRSDPVGVLVLAVAHQRRHPRYWSGRTDDPDGA